MFCQAFVLNDKYDMKYVVLKYDRKCSERTQIYRKASTYFNLGLLLENQVILHFYSENPNYFTAIHTLRI